MSNEYACQGCHKDKLIDPPERKFGEVTLIKVDTNASNLQVDQAMGAVRYELLGQQREYICDKCVQDARHGEFIFLAVFYVILLIPTWMISTEEMVLLFLLIAFIGTLIYFVLRNPDQDIRDSILKRTLKKTAVTRKESKYL